MDWDSYSEGLREFVLAPMPETEPLTPENLEAGIEAIKNEPLHVPPIGTVGRITQLTEDDPSGAPSLAELAKSRHKTKG